MTDGTETVDMELVADVTVAAEALTEETGRRIGFVVDKPPGLGGTDGGPMPSEYLLAAIGSCNLMTARRVAAARKVPYTSMRCRAVAHFDGSDIARVELSFRVESDAAEADWETVFRLAERSCTVSRATACPVVRTIDVVRPS